MTIDKLKSMPMFKAPLKRQPIKNSSETWSWADVVSQTKDANQLKFADNSSDDHLGIVNQKDVVIAAPIQESRKGLDEVDQSPFGNHSPSVDLVQDTPLPKKRGRPKKVSLINPELLPATPEVVAEDEDHSLCGLIRTKHKIRQRWHRAEKALTLQARAYCRSLMSEAGDADRYDDERLKALRVRQADALFKAVVEGGSHPKRVEAMLVVMPFLQARDLLTAQREGVEKEMEKLAAQLPVADFIRDTKGIALGGLASIIGETGDLLNYPTVAKLWKRCGVAVMPDGQRQRKVAGNIDDHKYAPSRRSVIWNVGNGLIGGMGRGKRPLVGEDISDKDWSPLEKLFVERLRVEVERHPEWVRPPTDEGKESYSKHAANRAKRYVEKRFLKMLWREWRKSAGLPFADQYSPD